MTEEIKEILEYLKNDNIEKPFGMATIDKKRLLNYITNLQKENLKLISENEAIKNIKYTVDETIYKSRNEKASDFILSKAKEYKPHFAKVELNTADCNDLLNILQGGDE